MSASLRKFTRAASPEQKGQTSPGSIMAICLRSALIIYKPGYTHVKRVSYVPIAVSTADYN